MVSQLFLKSLKTVFASVGTISATVIPFYYIQKSNWNWGDKNVSDFKKKLLDYGTANSIYAGETISNFVKKIFLTSEGKEQFTKHLIKHVSDSWFNHQSNSDISEQITQINKDWEAKFKEQKKELDETKESSDNEQNKIFDQNGGTKEDMRKRFFRNKTYEYFKQYMLNFDDDNFSINTSWNKKSDNSYDENFAIATSTFLTESDISNEANWEKIGFFPTKKNWNKLNDSQKKHIYGKFDFLNWAYKKWYSEKLPVYTLMSLWKHETKGGSEEEKNMLKNKYSETNITSEFPQTINYKFPIFNEATKEKFKKFVKALETIELNKDLSLSKEYTDDSATGILVNLQDAHDQLYTEFASGTTYLYNKLLSKNTCQDINQCINNLNCQAANASAITGNLHEMDYTNLKVLTDPLDIFLIKPNGANNSSVKVGTVNISKDIFKTSANAVNGAENSGSKNYLLYETREVKDKSWLFLRNTAGVHAIAIDGQKWISEKTNNGKCSFKNSFDFFNYRTLQLSKKNTHTNMKSLNMQPQAGAFLAFKNYLEEQFEKLMMSYIFQIDNAKNYLFHNLIGNDWEYFQQFGNISIILDEINFYKRHKNTIRNIRTKNLNLYGTREWEKATDEITVSKKLGLSGAFPYKVEKEDNKNLFPELEDIFSQTKYQGKNPRATTQANFLEKQKELAKKYEEELDTLFEKLNLKAKTHDDFLYSDRIYSNDSLINDLLDDYLDGPELVENLIKNTFLHSPTGSYLKQIFFDSNILDAQTFLLKGDAVSNSPAANTHWHKGESVNYQKLINKLKKEQISKTLFDGNKNLLFALNSFTNTDSMTDGTDTHEKIFKFLAKHGTTTFHENYFLSSSDFSKDNVNFLMTVNFLLKNNFENARNFLENKIKKGFDAFFVFKKNDAGLDDAKIKKVFDSLFINKDSTTFDASGTKETNAKNMNYVFAEKIKITTNNQGTPCEQNAANNGTDFYNYSGMSVFKLHSSNNNVLSIPDDCKNVKNTFGFNSRDEMIEYVKNIYETDQLNKLIARLKEKFSDKKAKLEKLEKTTITVSNATRNLYLQDRKNALISFINNYKFPSDNEMNDEKVKLIYGWDKSKNEYTNIPSTKQSSGDNFEENLKDDDFSKRECSKKDDFYLIQLKNDDFSTAEKFQDFLCKYLDEDMWLSIIFELAKDQEVKNLTEDNHLNEFAKLNIFDKKLQSALNARYFVS